MKHYLIRFGFVLALFLVVVVGAATLWAMYVEGHRASSASQLDSVVRALSAEQQVGIARRDQDTQGGISPTEVLANYMRAVEEHRDAEAASYFVVDRQTEELHRLASSSDAMRSRLLELLSSASHASGTYSAAHDAYTIRDPILIDFLRYPNGLWKLVEL